MIQMIAVEKVKQIAIAVSRFFNSNHLYHDANNYGLTGCRKWSLIAISTHHGDLALLQFIVNKIKLKNVRQTERVSALFLAASEGHLDIYDFLTKKLRDKNPGKKSLLNRKGRTPLHWAAKNGHFAVCKLIIDRISDKNPAETNAFHSGDTPLHLAAKKGHLEVCKLIMDNLIDKNPANAYPRQETPYHYAARNGKLAVCQLFYDTLLDKNPATPDGLTPLHYAAENGHVEVCKLIMKNLVDKNPRTGYGWGSRLTPLDFASVNDSWDDIATRNRKLEVCQLFHENGIYINGHFPTPSPYADVI